ncbi:patatin-like phospholipase family protein [Vibrio penaeicida]|uniref:patatin-like phospholipase family protein n=1 Tax=Vibrio penaeicida TaxID=104609 RepID=UPI002734A15C|nr:patatin-like phospholipase family protein [Vibrio penaeicida]MDP2571220.1 patatin-like phospholipase family protein [Vibrio penaeicida]
MADQITKHNHYLYQVVLPEELKHVLQRKVVNRDGQALERSPRSLPDFEQTLIPWDQRSVPLNQTIESLTDKNQEQMWNEDSSVLHPGLVGLCFSGGGIRSATFNLGVIQAFKKSGLLNNVDYLSTVSGGGYIGSAFSSAMTGAVTNEQYADKKTEAIDALFTHEQGDVEPSEFRHLRNNSNYMAPNGGLDTIRVPAIFLRGIVLNALVVLPYLLIFAMVMAFLSTSPLGFYSDYASWLEHIGLGAHFPVTKSLMLLLLLNYIGSALTTNATENVSSSNNQSWIWRDRITSAIAINVAAIFGSAIVEAQPLALEWYQTLVLWGISLHQMGINGFAIAIVCSLLLAKVISNLSKISNQLVVGCIGFSAIFACWVVVLDVSDSLVTQETSYTAIVSLTIALMFLNQFTGSANFTAVNRFYRDRLSLAYLFKKQSPFPHAPIIHTDKLKLSELDSEYAPYSLINCTLNGGQSVNAYKKDRLGENFIFSKCFSGSNKTGFCKTQDLEASQPSINLGTATAISGAAVAPNMGRNTVKPLVFLLAMLNIRYDYWVKNPSKIHNQEQSSSRTWWKKLFRNDRVGPSYFLKELLGNINTSQNYINLSDGGHFENLGLYELVRRECRLIIISDAEADLEGTFSGLMDAIRMIQTDFGIKITMTGLDEIKQKNQAHAHGEIHYRNGRVGKILYIKSVMTHPEDMMSTDVPSNNDYFDKYRYIANYQSKNPAFPNQSSGDQFFDEAQFEAYRALGYQVAYQTLFNQEQSISESEDSFSNRRSA